MPERTYDDWRDQMAALQEQGQSADDLAGEAANQGEDVITITRLLRDLFRLPVKEALGAALFALHGPKYGQPVGSKLGEGGS